jgi:hypothetical protein
VEIAAVAAGAPSHFGNCNCERSEAVSLPSLEIALVATNAPSK